MKPVQRGESSKIHLTGRYSYTNPENKIKILSYQEGAHLFIGGFNSIAEGLTVYLGGNHRTDWCSTYPFGHFKVKEFPNGSIKDTDILLREDT